MSRGRRRPKQPSAQTIVRTRSALKRETKLDPGDQLIAKLKRPCPKCGALERQACRNASGAEMLRFHPQR